MLPNSLAPPLTRVRRRLLAHRRLLAGLLTTVAVAGALRIVAPAAPETVAVTVAARDLAAGETLTPADVATAHVLPGSVPDGTTGRIQGATLAGPVRRGEPITDVRLVGPSLTIAHPGLTALPIRLPDGAMAGLLDAGDRIDLYAVPSAAGTSPGGTAAAGASPGGTGAQAPDTAGAATRVAAGVLVLAVPPAKEAGSSVTTGLSGRLILVGLPDDAVAHVTDASVRSFLTFAFVH